MAAKLTAEDLKARAKSVLDTLANKHDLTPEGNPYLHESVKSYHDSMAPAEGKAAFLARFSYALQHLPNLKAEFVDAVAEGNKVWVFSVLSGFPDGNRKESVDMMVFDDEGMLIETKDVQRAV